jgi:Flp pilus assembly protein TadD/SH3-like domain-containing protein
VLPGVGKESTADKGENKLLMAVKSSCAWRLKMNKQKLSEQGVHFRRKKSSVIGICMVLLIFLTACSHKARVADYHSAKMAAMEAQQQAQWNQEKKMENLSAEKLILAGNSYLAHDNHQLAKLHFAMAVKKNPKLAPAYTGLGEALVLGGQSQKARGAFERAIAIDDGDKTALLALGKICRGQGKYVESQKYLEQAKTQFPDDPEILTELAITLDTMGREVEAEPLYRKVTELMPYHASAYNNLGFNFLLQKNYSEAVNSFYQALRLAQDNKRIRNNLAVAYLLTGEEQKAVNLLKRTVGEAGAYNNIGYIYMVHGECAKAEKAFERALDLNPHYYIRAHANQEQLNNSCFLPGVISVGSKLLPDNELSPPPKSTEITEYTIVPDSKGVVISSKKRPQTEQLPKKVRLKRTRIVKVYTGNLRDDPSLEAQVLGYLKKDEKVIELLQKNDWCFIKRANGHLGWAHKSLLSDTVGDVSVTEKSSKPSIESPSESALTPAPILQASGKKKVKIETVPPPVTVTASLNKDQTEDSGEVEAAGKSSKNVDKKDVPKLVHKSFVLVSQGKFAAAIEAADKAISLDSSLINPYINRAWALSEMGQYDKAISDCNTVLTSK